MKFVSTCEEVVRKAVGILKAGGVVIAPTDSVYGLFGDALNENTVNRIRAIKGRDGKKPFQIAVLKEDAGKYGKLGESALKVIEKYWPGGVNIIVEKKTTVPDYVSINTVCLTCHGSSIMDAIVRGAGRPLVSTSANLGGMPPATKVGEIPKEVLEKADLVIDRGETKNKTPNTIVDLTKTPAEIVREGPVKKKQLETLIEIKP